MYVTCPSQFVENSAALHLDAFLPAEKSERISLRTIPAGKLLFCEGDESLHVFEVVEGVVRSSKVLCDGRRQIISFGYPGDLVGISHDCRYHTDCQALTDVKVRVHHSNACSAQTSSEPEFCNRLLRHTASEMCKMQEHFMMLGRKSAMEKVASFLCVLVNRVGSGEKRAQEFDLPMPRSDIADFLGLTIETVSRTLTKLRKDGLIDLPTPHRVVVLQPGKLFAYAERDE